MTNLERFVPGIKFTGWKDGATQMQPVMRLIEKDLSEPYSIFTYRFFINNFPNLCYLAYDDSEVTTAAGAAAACALAATPTPTEEAKKGGEDEATAAPPTATESTPSSTTTSSSSRGKLVGVIVCKAERKRGEWYNGYIAMLAVDSSVRGKGIGSQLVIRAVNEMERMGCVEVILETEMANKAALSLYQNLGFVRETRLEKYYLNGGAAFRLKLWLPKPVPVLGAYPGGLPPVPPPAAAAAADAAAAAAAAAAAVEEIEEEDGLPPFAGGGEDEDDDEDDGGVALELD